jgi:manganese/iron transport system ATP-binding protein
MVVNHDLGESITNFDQFILLNKELIAAGPREWVLNRDNITRAYGGHVGFFGNVA